MITQHFWHWKFTIAHLINKQERNLSSILGTAWDFSINLQNAPPSFSVFHEPWEQIRLMYSPSSQEISFCISYSWPRRTLGQEMVQKSGQATRRTSAKGFSPCPGHCVNKGTCMAFSVWKKTMCALDFDQWMVLLGFHLVLALPAHSSCDSHLVPVLQAVRPYISILSRLRGEEWFRPENLFLESSRSSGIPPDAMSRARMCVCARVC